MDQLEINELNRSSGTTEIFAVYKSINSIY